MKDRWHVRCNSRKIARGHVTPLKFRWKWQAANYISDGYRKKMWGFYFDSVDLIDTKTGKVRQITK